MSTTAIPSVWVGCVSCYASSRLIGQWFTATEIADVTLDDVHDGTDGPWPECEELDIFDSENLPSNANLTLDGVAAWGDAYAELVDADNTALWPAYVALANDWHAADPDNCTVEQFTDQYQGCFASFDEFASDLADDIGLTDGWPETAVCYFDERAWARDLKCDYTVIDAPDGGVFVYRNQ